MAGDKVVEAKLFDDPPAIKPDAFCRTCKHRQPWECGSMTIQYCGARGSNRTDNGLLKIRAKDPACVLYEFNSR